MNAKTSVFVLCVEVIIYLLLYNLHDCTFKGRDAENYIKSEGKQKNGGIKAVWKWKNCSLKKKIHEKYKQYQHKQYQHFSSFEKIMLLWIY